MKAFFIRNPRRAEDLCRPHIPEQEHTFEIVKHITLTEIDYENLSFDMLTDNFLRKTLSYAVRVLFLNAC